MARRPHETDFKIAVEGVGTFIFARRRMADEVAIQVEFARIISGVEPTAWLSAVGGWISVFKVLTVLAPPDWNIDEMDPSDDETYAKMSRVYDELIEQERSFRRKPEQVREAAGAGTP